MPRPKRDLIATEQNTLIPPHELGSGQFLAKITKAASHNLFYAELPGGKPVLAELGEKFRSKIFIKRGSYVVVDSTCLADRENKLDGEIVNVVRDEKQWRKMGYWPKEFAKKSTYAIDSDDEESTVGKMPPSSEDEYEN